MSRVRSTLPRVEVIPPELCTRKEAAEILGLRPNSACAKSKRYKVLRFAEVVYKNKRVLLYNRKEVEALVYPIQPEDCISTKEASKLLNYCVNHPSAVTRFLARHGIPRKWQESRHSYFVYPRKEVEALREKLLTNPPRCHK